MASKFLKISPNGAAMCGNCGELDIWQKSATVNQNGLIVIEFICNPCKEPTFLTIQQEKDATYFAWNK